MDQSSTCALMLAHIPSLAAALHGREAAAARAARSAQQQAEERAHEAVARLAEAQAEATQERDRWVRCWGAVTHQGVVRARLMNTTQLALHGYGPRQTAVVWLFPRHHADSLTHQLLGRIHSGIALPAVHFLVMACTCLLATQKPLAADSSPHLDPHWFQNRLHQELQAAQEEAESLRSQLAQAQQELEARQSDLESAREQARAAEAVAAAAAEEAAAAEAQHAAVVSAVREEGEALAGRLREAEAQVGF